MVKAFKKKQKWNEEMYSRFSTKRLYDNKNFIVRFVEQKRIENVLDFLKIKKNDKVIEIGCEAGYLLKHLLGAKEVVGLDIAKNALKDARENIKSDKVKLVCADASDIPFKEHYFDKVICSQILEHLDNPSEVVAEVYRIVKPGGTVIVSVPCEGIVTGVKKIFVKIGLFRLFFPNLEPGTSAWHIQSFNKKTICKILNNYFKIQRFRYVPIPFIGPDMIIKCRPRSKIYESQ